MIGVMWVFAIEAGDLPVSVKKAEKSCVRYLCRVSARLQISSLSFTHSDELS